MKNFRLKISEIFWNNIFAILTSVAVGIFYTIYHQNFLPEDKETETIIAIVVFFTGLFYNLINFKIARDQFFKSLFAEFNQKYDAMNEALNAVVSGKADYIINGKEKTKEAIIIDYLNLCAEEYLWYKKGRIDTEVWKAWKAGMIYYFKQEAFKEEINKQREQKDSYYGLFEVLGEL